MMSPTRRVAHNLATKAFVSSSLLSTSLAGKSNDFLSSPTLPRSLTFAAPLVAIPAHEHHLVAGKQIELALRVQCD